MAKANGTIWAVVSFYNDGKNYDWFNYRVYSKTSSNFEKMMAYCEEIKVKHPACKVFLTSRENAKKGERDYCNWYRKNFKKEREKRRKKLLTK